LAVTSPRAQAVLCSIAQAVSSPRAPAVPSNIPCGVGDGGREAPARLRHRTQPTSGDWDKRNGGAGAEALFRFIFCYFLQCCVHCLKVLSIVLYLSFFVYCFLCIVVQCFVLFMLLFIEWFMLSNLLFVLLWIVLRYYLLCSISDLLCCALFCFFVHGFHFIVLFFVHCFFCSLFFSLFILLLSMNIVCIVTILCKLLDAGSYQMFEKSSSPN
jgi:hypothetical protein